MVGPRSTVVPFAACSPPITWPYYYRLDRLAARLMKAAADPGPGGPAQHADVRIGGAPDERSRVLVTDHEHPPVEGERLNGAWPARDGEALGHWTHPPLQHIDRKSTRLNSSH